MLLTFISGRWRAIGSGKGAATYHDLTLIAGLAIENSDRRESDLRSDDRGRCGGEAADRSDNHWGHGTGQEDQYVQPHLRAGLRGSNSGTSLQQRRRRITALLGGHTELSGQSQRVLPQWRPKLVALVVARKPASPSFRTCPRSKERKLDVTFRMFRIAAPRGSHRRWRATMRM